MPKVKDNYMNNPNLPVEGAKFEYTPEMVKDLKKAKDNLLYFAENFFYIVNLDKGRMKIPLFNCQTRILKKMRDNRFFIVLASRQVGKALSLDTPIYTTNGWKNMGSIKSGDYVIGSTGKPVKVNIVHDIMYNRDCYEVLFDNGEKIISDGEHNWFTQTEDENKNNIKGSVKTTKEILNTLKNTFHRIPKSANQNNNIWNYIKKIKKVNSVPVRCITVDSDDGLYQVSNSLILTHNTTLFTIYSLWQACFNNDQRILIVANKEGTALEIMGRIRMAYEELPNWLKPGVKEYGKSSITLANGSKIGISTTTGTAARGQSVNLLLIDELAFIEPHLVEDFWKSVYPIISSSKKSKIFIASTANGTDNLFYKIYTGAEEGNNGWAYEKVLWNEIPGRDEEFKQHAIQSLGSEEAFRQEFNCEFIQSGESSLSDEIYYELESKAREPQFIFDDGKYLLWEEPNDNGIYVAGIDTAEGVGRDNSVIQILDLSDLTNIKQVATYVDNKIAPYNFTKKVHEILEHWGNPLACIERNNCGGQVVDTLKNKYDYENIVSWGSSIAKRSKVQLGIISHTNTKFKGVTNMRYWLNDNKALQLNDKKLITELKNFVKYPNGKWEAKKGFHDDRVAALMWSLIILIDDLVNQYFEVAKYDTNNKPLVLEQFDYGIKYFMNPTNIYTNEKEGESFDGAMPFIIGSNNNQADEMSELINQGWKVWTGK